MPPTGERQREHQRRDPSEDVEISRRGQLWLIETVAYRPEREELLELAMADVKANRNLVLRRVGAAIVMVQNKETPTDAEWDEFLTLLVDHRPELPKLRLLVLTAGGGPSAAQRKRLESALGGTPMRVAVVSDNMKVRFVASTIALFHKDHRSFLTREVDEAYDHLGLNTSERRSVQAVIKDLEPAVRNSVAPPMKVQ